MIRWAVPVAVLLVVAGRIVALSQAMLPPPQLPAITLDAEGRLKKHGEVQRVEYQRFDERAVVAAGPGPDGKPGVAGTDDNINGITDDRLELGATRSDDPCLVLTEQQFADRPAEQWVVLQRGAYVAAGDHQRPSRAVIHGRSTDGRPWSMLVDLNRPDNGR